MRRTTAIATLLLACTAARAERGALSLDVAGGGVAELVPAPYVAPGSRSTLCISAAAELGLRYAVSHSAELSLTGFALAPAALYQNRATVLLDTGSYPGTLQHQYLRFGASAGARLVLGLRLRFVLGLEAGWSHAILWGLQHWDVRPDGAVPYSLELRTVTREALLLSPLLGLEWAAGDHWSLSLLPRAHVLVPVGGREGLSWAIILPLQWSWSWYL